MENNKMGVLPIKKLIITISVPIMISMLVQSLYNIIDSMFVAKIGENALTAVSLAFPIQSLMIAFSTGTGVGINALVARKLGEKNQKDASLFANNGIVLLVLTSLAFLIFGIFGSRMFFASQTNNAEIIDYGTTYMSIVTIGSIGLFLEIAFERILQATGRTIQTMIMQLSGAITNIILDPILIFGLFGLPKMGIAGAAFATIIGQLVAGTLGIYFNHRHNPDLDMHFHQFKLKWEVVKEIYSIAIPSIIMSSISSIMSFTFNQILARFSNTAIAFFGVYMKLQSFVFMPVFGLNNGLVPIISYNFGAKSKTRVMETIKLGTFYGVLILLLGFALFELFPKQLLQIFTPSAEMLKIGVIGLRIIAIHFLLAGVNIVFSSVFQALSHAKVSMFISIVRQLVVLVPCGYLLSLTNNLNMVWLSPLISEIVTICLSLYYFKKIYDEQIQYI